MQDVAFILAMSLMFTHELDAIHRHEWRIFPGTSLLDDKAGFMVFVVLHIPVFAGVLWASFPQQADTGAGFRIAFGMFCVIHVGLHKLFERHLSYEFNNPFSQFLIWASGVAGAGYVFLAW